MNLLDTNVVSEIMKATPEPRVMAWVDSMPAATLVVSSITEAEVLYGIALLPEGQRRDALATAARKAFHMYFADRILPFESRAAACFANLAARRRRLGRPISQLDAQIAAIARAHRASIVTRNVQDFTDCGIEVIDPWGDTQDG